ncbi:MAG: aminopeptidase P family N-terminal domain-containing protein, partial [Alphaproteobacteria bacterium]|nr:aminopeptidase P family N-terminal domain-containing protein [Alphaproteobacteria bacterium]
MDREQSLVFHNGEKAPSVFTEEEFARRQAALRDTMAEAGLDACVLTSIHNINYFSGFVYCSFGRQYGLVVTADHVTSISAKIDGGQPWRRTHGENLIFTDWQRDNFFRAVQELVPPGGRVGIEHDHLSLERLDKLRAALPEAELVDIAPATMALRMVKSDEEITLIRHGAEIADIGG